MGTSTSSKRHLATVALIAGALTMLVPVAQADSGFKGSPDAIDRALAARQLEMTAVLDARERSMLTRPDLGSVAAPPDAFERALQNRPTGTPPLPLQHFLANDARQRSLDARHVGSVQRTVSSTGFDWDAFGVGAGAGIGFILATLALGVGVLVVRRGHGRVTNP
ncbi:MAG: hypothetical protein WD015_03140 [Gaiellaceae bacterium]